MWLRVDSDSDAETEVIRRLRRRLFYTPVAARRPTVAIRNIPRSNLDHDISFLALATPRRAWREVRKRRFSVIADLWNVLKGSENMSVHH